MELIDKAAIVAEIERRKQTWQHQDQQYVNGGKDVCDYLLGFLDTLEVREKDSTDAFIEKACKSIPISPKVLVRSGFTLRFDGWLWCAEDGNEYQDYIFIQLRRGGEDGFGVRKCEINFFKKAQAVFRNIQYAHQLQQLLRFCGINKEIIVEE